MALALGIEEESICVPQNRMENVEVVVFRECTYLGEEWLQRLWIDIPTIDTAMHCGRNLRQNCMQYE